MECVGGDYRVKVFGLLAERGQAPYYNDMDSTMNDKPAQEKQQTVANEQVKKPGKSRRWVIVSVILLMLLAGAGVLYYVQYKKLSSANASVDNLTSSNKKLSAELSSTQSKLSTLQTEYNKILAANAAPVSQSDLLLKVIAAQYVNPGGTVTAGGTWFGVRLTLTNNTSSAISVTASNFTLKDSQGNIYQQAGFMGASTLPSGWGINTLQDQAIPANGTVTGNLIFHVASITPASYTLVNGSKPYSVSVTN